MDYSVEQEFKKVWGALRCKANCNSVGGTPSLPLNSIQYNNAGAFFGDALFTRDPVTNETIIGLTGTDLASNLQITPTGNTITWDADTTDTIVDRIEQNENILGEGIKGNLIIHEDTFTSNKAYIVVGDTSAVGGTPFQVNIGVDNATLNNNSVLILDANLILAAVEDVTNNITSDLALSVSGNTILWDADTTDTITTTLQQNQDILGLGGLSGSALTWQDTGTEIVGFVGAVDGTGLGLYPGSTVMTTDNLAAGASASITTNYDNVLNIANAIANVANGDFDSGFEFDDTEALIRYKNNTTGLNSSIHLDANSVITAYTLDGTTEYQTVLGDGRFKIFDSTNNIKYLIIDIINSSMTINPTLVPTYADDAAAGVGGLTSGQLYKTTTLGSTYLKIVP